MYHLTTHVLTLCSQTFTPNINQICLYFKIKGHLQFYFIGVEDLFSFVQKAIIPSIYSITSTFHPHIQQLKTSKSSFSRPILSSSNMLDFLSSKSGMFLVFLIKVQFSLFLHEKIFILEASLLPDSTCFHLHIFQTLKLFYIYIYICHNSNIGFQMGPSEAFDS